MPFEPVRMRGLDLDGRDRRLHAAKGSCGHETIPASRCTSRKATRETRRSRGRDRSSATPVVGRIGFLVDVRRGARQSRRMTCGISRSVRPIRFQRVALSDQPNASAHRSAHAVAGRSMRSQVGVAELALDEVHRDTLAREAATLSPWR
jgi:hypothetical protein